MPPPAPKPGIDDPPNVDGCCTFIAPGVPLFCPSPPPNPGEGDPTPGASLLPPPTPERNGDFFPTDEKPDPPSIFAVPKEFEIDGIPPLPNPPESMLPFNGPDPAPNPGKDDTPFLLESIPNSEFDFI